MDYFALIFLALGLAMDAFSVSVTNGAVSRHLKIKHYLILSFSFALFQTVMPIIGWKIGKAGENFLSYVSHFVAFILLMYIGLGMIYDSLGQNSGKVAIKINPPLKLRFILAMSIATSIDALATGIILPYSINAISFADMLTAALVIGIITFILCFTGIFIGNKFGELLGSKSGIFGGCVLISIGSKIFLESIYF